MNETPNNAVPDYRWIKWLTWIPAAIVVTMLGRNLLVNDSFDFATVEWVILGVCVAVDIFLRILKWKLEADKG
jgi:uncharacterized membrane protein YdjX (TVP38/TMEM64 family)